MKYVHFYHEIIIKETTKKKNRIFFYNLKYYYHNHLIGKIIEKNIINKIKIQKSMCESFNFREIYPTNHGVLGKLRKLYNLYPTIDHGVRFWESYTGKVVL